jgi:hypothetical protein
LSGNITALANTGTGTDVLATDLIGGAHYARSKLVIGADGVNDGDVSASNPLPVTATALTTLAAATALEDTPAASGDRGMVVLGMRRDADTTTVDADGDYTALKMDEAGRLKVAAQPGSYSLSTTAITANAQTAFVDCSRGSNIVAHMVATSLVGHNATFEASIDSTNGTDGTWFAIQAIRTNANTIELVTGVLAATPAYGWELSVNGFKYMRVRATAHTSGTATWKFQQAPYATEPIPAAQISGTQPVSGTVTATVGTSITGGAISPLTVAGATVEASSAKTATGNGTTQTNANGTGAMFYINVSAASGTTPTLAVRVQVQDPVSTTWFDINGAVTPTLTGISTAMLTVYPGISEAANTKVSQALPRTYRVAWTIGGTTPSFTFSVGVQYII